MSLMRVYAWSNRVPDSYNSKFRPFTSGLCALSLWEMETLIVCVAEIVGLTFTTKLPYPPPPTCHFSLIEALRINLTQSTKGWLSPHEPRSSDGRDVRHEVFHEVFFAHFVPPAGTFHISIHWKYGNVKDVHLRHIQHETSMVSLSIRPLKVAAHFVEVYLSACTHPSPCRPPSCACRCLQV